MIELVGVLSPVQTLIGYLTEAETLTGYLVSLGPGEEYDGETNITPGPLEQVLQTAGKRVPSNIVVGPIPSNYGLITQIGPGIRVS